MQRWHRVDRAGWAAAVGPRSGWARGHGCGVDLGLLQQVSDESPSPDARCNAVSPRSSLSLTAASNGPREALSDAVTDILGQAGSLWVVRRTSSRQGRAAEVRVNDRVVFCEFAAGTV